VQKDEFKLGGLVTRSFVSYLVRGESYGCSEIIMVSGNQKDVKLSGTENYRVWAAAMKLPFNTRNNTGFINEVVSYLERLFLMLRMPLLLFPKRNLIKALPLPLVVLSLNLRCFVLIGYPPGYDKNLGLKQNGFKFSNANFAFTSNENGTSLSLTNEQMMRLINLINEVPSRNMQANMADVDHLKMILEKGQHKA
nr:hypothetical protein [Tanacetum cinerariifolium]